MHKIVSHGKFSKYFSFLTWFHTLNFKSVNFIPAVVWLCSSLFTNKSEFVVFAKLITQLRKGFHQWRNNINEILSSFSFQNLLLGARDLTPGAALSAANDPISRREIKEEVYHERKVVKQEPDYYILSRPTWPPEPNDLFPANLGRKQEKRGSLKEVNSGRTS